MSNKTLEEIKSVIADAELQKGVLVKAIENLTADQQEQIGTAKQMAELDKQIAAAKHELKDLETAKASKKSSEMDLETYLAGVFALATVTDPSDAYIDALIRRLVAHKKNPGTLVPAVGSVSKNDNGVEVHQLTIDQLLKIIKGKQYVLVPDGNKALPSNSYTKAQNYPVFIPKKYVKKINPGQGKDKFYAISIFKYNARIFIPWAKLKPTADGAGYEAWFKAGQKFTCEFQFRGKMATDMFLPFFPKKKTGEH